MTTHDNSQTRPTPMRGSPGGGGGGGELNLDHTGMCHRRLKFLTLFWSGKTQKGYPALELPLLP